MTTNKYLTTPETILASANAFLYEMDCAGEVFEEFELEFTINKQGYLEGFWVKDYDFMNEKKYRTNVLFAPVTSLKEIRNFVNDCIEGAYEDYKVIQDELVFS